MVDKAVLQSAHKHGLAAFVADQGHSCTGSLMSRSHQACARLKQAGIARSKLVLWQDFGAEYHLGAELGLGTRPRARLGTDNSRPAAGDL